VAAGRFLTSILDLYYTKSHEKDNARSIEVNTSGYPAPCCDGDFTDAGITQFQITNPTIRENSTVAGTLSTVLPLVRNFQFITTTRSSRPAGTTSGRAVAGIWRAM